MSVPDPAEISGLQLLSIVVPCFNEEEVIGETIRRLKALCDGLAGLNIEIVFVDDGSRDRTRDIILEHAEQDPRLKLLSFARNFGHQIAVSAGAEASSGDAVVVIDADLQDPPEVIGKMVDKWREGFDVVYGVRTDRPGETAFKLATARSFYRFLNALSDVPIPLDAGDFRLMSRRVVNILNSMPERDRFVRGMVSWVGFRQTPLPYRRAERFAGTSKYPLRKMLRFAADGILSFSTRPLQLAINLGFLFSLMSLIGIVYVIAVRLFTKEWVAGWTTIVVSILFIGGVQLICTGIMGEYIGRIYNEVKRRPLYIIRDRHGFEPDGHE